MASKTPTAFQRLFPSSEFRHGPILRASVWSAIGSLLMCLLLLDGYLLLDLLVHGGRLHIPAQQQSDLELLVFGENPPQPTVSAAAGGAGEVVYENRGLLPEVWLQRDRSWGRLLIRLYRGIPALQTDAQALGVLVALAGLLAILRHLIESRARALRMYVALDVATRLRQAIHRQTLRLGPSDLQGTQGAQALELFTNEVDFLRDGIFLWADRLGRDVLQLALFVVLAIIIHPIVALACLMPLAACWYLSQQKRQEAEDARGVADALSSKQLRLLAESLAKTRLVRGYGMETFEQEQFQKYLQRFQQNTAAALKATSWSQRAVRVLVIGCLSFVIFFIGMKILRSPGELSFSAGLLMLVAIGAGYFPLERLLRTMREHPRAESAAGRISAYLTRIPEVGQAVGAKFLQPLSRSLEFDSVSYTTADKRRLLDGLDLKIPAGRTVAFISTEPLESIALAYLVPRFIEPQSGRVLIDGEDISWVTLESLRAESIFVGGSDPFLTGSVRENISAGSRTDSLQDVTEAARLTHAHNFILKLPQGYETVIGEHGEQLDAGQSFRLGLTRAVLRKPALLIIEEPSEQLDEDTKALIDDAYVRITQNRTTVFLPSRMSTLRRCDEIVFIHKGRVAAIGTHARLVATSELYRHWEYMKFNQFRDEA